MRRAISALLLTGLLVSCGSSDSDEPTAGTDTASAATEPPATEPPASEPPTTEPPATEPPTTEPPATEPPTTEPPAAMAPSIRDVIDGGAIMNLAHAGGDQDAPHSTMFAFAESVANGANALEMDVMLTADGVLIVQHDDTVDRTTEATGPVADLTLAEIQALDNAHWFAPQCWTCRDLPVEQYVYRGVRTGDVEPPDGYTAEDFRVVTFREVATAFPALPLDIEIKGSFPDAVPAAEALAAEIAELDRTDSVVVVSFDDEVVDAFHAIAPEVAVSPGLTRLTAWFLEGAEIEPHFEVFQMPPFQGDIEVITPEVVQRIHDEGRVVWVWPDDAGSQENEEFYRLLLSYGVDGVIAGRPAMMTAALAS